MTQESAEVVVVGGGAIGTSTAYHLAELGLVDVTVVERDSLGSGSTSKAAGGIRTQFSDELNVRIGLRSLTEFETFADLIGVDIAFHQTGYLFLLDNNADAQAFHRAIALQRDLGLANIELAPAEAAALVPGLVTDDLVTATLQPPRRPRNARGSRRGHAVASRPLSPLASTPTEGARHDHAAQERSAFGRHSGDLFLVAGGISLGAGFPRTLWVMQPDASPLAG